MCQDDRWFTNWIVDYALEAENGFTDEPDESAEDVEAVEVEDCGWRQRDFV